VGASERTFAGRIVQQNLAQLDFAGLVSLVHPRRRDVDGIRCIPRLEDLESAPDLVVCVTGASAVPDILGQASALGVPWAVVPGGGRTEDAAAGAQLTAFLEDPLIPTRVVGPNCMGFVSPDRGLAAYVGSLPRSLRDGQTALLSQSGAVVEAFATQGPRVGYRLLMSTGHEAGVTSEDLIEFLLDEERVQTILLWQEGATDPERLLRLINRANEQGVRVCVARVGRSAGARESATTHTQRLTGDWELWSSVLRRQGAVIAQDLDELHELGALLEGHRRTSGRIWAATNSGGQGAQLADTLHSATHIELPQPSAQHSEAFSSAFPRAAAPRNPMDLWALAGWKTACREGFRSIVEHGGGGTLVASVDASSDQGDEEGEIAAEMVREACAAAACHPDWTVVHLAPVAASPHPLLEDALCETGCASIRGAAGVRALVALLRPTGPRIGEELYAAMGEGGGTTARMSHDRAFEMLAFAGINVPRTVLVDDEDDAVIAVRQLQEPLVVKVVGPMHRAAVGGVALGVLSRDIVRTCSQLARIKDCAGFEIMEHVIGDMELLLHVGRDPQLGPAATLGVGGSLAEIAHRSVRDLAPCSLAEARRMLGHLLGEPHATDWSTEPWMQHVAETLVSLGDLIRSGTAEQVEINPLIVNRFSGTVHAVDVIGFELVEAPRSYSAVASAQALTSSSSDGSVSRSP
jgi:acetyltransferase